MSCLGDFQIGDFQKSRSPLYPVTVVAVGWAMPTIGKKVFQTLL